MTLGVGTSDLIATVGVMLAAAIAYYFYKKGLHRKNLSFAVDKKTLVFRTRDYPSELKLIYGGHEIEKLIRCTVYAWNTGNQPILRSDLDTRTPLKITISGIRRVLQSSIGRQSRTTNNVSLLDDLIMKFDYLNAGDGFIVDIFVEAEDANSIEIKLDGEMIGANQMPNQEVFADKSEFRVARNELIKLIIALFIMTQIYFYPKILSDFLGMLMLVMAILMIILSLISLAVDTNLFRNRIPAGLMLGENSGDWRARWKWRLFGG